MKYSTPWIIPDRKIRVALTGYGRISDKHLEAIAAHADHLELTAVCDSDEAAARAASERLGVDFYTSYDDMLAKAEIDLVILCTPSGLHPAQAIKAARSGRHVLTEKPMATRWQDGLHMVRTCEEEGVRLFVMKQNRLNATVQSLKRAVDEDRFGKIYMAVVNVFWTRPQAYYDQASWRGTWDLDGGAFMNQASHYIDLLHWLLGPIESVQAMTGTLGRKIEAEDTGVMSVRWRHGAIGTVNVTMLTWPQNLEGSITVLGEKGSVRIGGMALNEIQHWTFQDTKPEDEKILANNYKTDSVYGFGHTLYYKNVIETLQGKAKPLTCGRGGLASLELLVAACRSARDGVQVHLPLEL